ncbi:hypothetical protein [Selenomonas ruminantium]|uniref:hypothetical protein n=1 Tax=Selenomonas ruminantium TaxID=971 RepID=UPI0026ED10DF|nr:hypothetical protein [Selenomonas ruminantium]
MKKLTAIFTVLLLLAMTIPAMAASIVNKDGYYKGVKLCGKVKVVEHFADIKVQVVNSFPDLRVKVVDSFPTILASGSLWNTARTSRCSL